MCCVNYFIKNLFDNKDGIKLSQRKKSDRNTMFRKGQGIDKYDGKSVFKVNEGGKYKMEGWKNFVNLLSDENQHKLFQLKHNFLIKT